MRGRRASEVDTSVRLGGHQWSVIDAVNQPLKSGGIAVARWGCMRKVENYILFAEAVHGLRCLGNLTAQSHLQFGYLQQFHGVGGFLLPVHPLFSLPLWAPPKPLAKLGNIRNHDTSRIFPVIAHSKGKEARKLEALSIPGREYRGKTHQDENLRWPLGERTHL